MSSISTLSVYYEYLDLNRFPDPAYQQQMFDLFAAKYRNKQVNLVILTEEAMLNLWLEQRGGILPTTPVVFYDLTIYDSSGDNFRQVSPVSVDVWI